MGEKSQNKNKNSRVAQNFYIIVLNFMENDQKSKKLGTFYKFLHTLRAYFCLIFTSFWKKLIFAPPPGGGLSSRIFTIAERPSIVLHFDMKTGSYNAALPKIRFENGTKNV